MKLHLGKRAQRLIDKNEAWWADRGDSKRFTDELQATLELLQGSPYAGAPWPTKKRPTLRRILMPDTQNYLYYRIDERQNVLRVLSVWGTPKKGAPKL